MLEIKIIKEKLHELKQRDTHFSIFGASKHKYQNFPVSLAEIDKFQTKYEFTLPENFRLFLTEIGYGAGHYYGILNLSEISKYIEGWFSIDYLLRPIEWTFHTIGLKSKNPFDRKTHPEKPFQLTLETIERINTRLKTEDWEFSGDCAEFSNYPADGTILICHPGCHYEIALVTSGELSGSVWSVECDGESSNWIPDEFRGESGQVQITSFETWYENWLNFSLSQFVRK